jgi:hypothetical protein
VFEFEFYDVGDDRFERGARADDARFQSLAFGHKVFLLLLVFIRVDLCLKGFPTENCWPGRVHVTGRGPLQPCRNGAIARRGRGKRRPARVFALRDANAKALFSVGNYLATDSRKTFRAQPVRAAARERIPAHTARLRLVPRANAFKF